MGCVASKDGAPVTPALDFLAVSGNLETAANLDISGEFRPSPSLWNGPRPSNYQFSDKPESGESEKKSSAGNSSVNSPPRNQSRSNEGEQVAAGWPAWLSGVAGEAIRGWVPLKAEAFEKSEKIKCYMHQLLSGIDHCHSRGIMHRDIKCSNLLVNNEGILKIADFGLANILDPAEKQLLTSRVVTLWYRPPELLLGSVDYDTTVDLWSVGCVFAELFLGKPILQGRTEIEQIHKNFKLCGSPPGEFWKKTKLPQAMVIMSQHAYENCLQRTFEFLPDNAFKLLETFLSVETAKRGTAFAALNSEYFKTKPYACEPSSLPKYNPSKEIDAKYREDPKRSVNGKFFEEGTKGPSKSHKILQELNGLGKTTHKEALRNAVETDRSSIKEALHDSRKPDLPLPNMKFQEEHRRVKQIPRNPQSGPMHIPTTGFACAKKPKEGPLPIKSQNRSRSKQSKFCMLDPTLAEGTFKLNGEENGDPGFVPFSNAKVQPYESAKEEMLRRWIHPEFQDSIYSFVDYDSHDVVSKNRIMVYKDQGVEFSGPVLLQSKKVDEFLEKHEQYICRATRKSWFQRAQKQRN